MILTSVLDQRLCGNASVANKKFVSVICSPKLHGRVIVIKNVGANKRVALCEVEVYSEVRVACKFYMVNKGE